MTNMLHSNWKLVVSDYNESGRILPALTSRSVRGIPLACPAALSVDSVKP